MYNPGMKLQNIVLKTIDNSIPEPEIIYNIKLIGITGVGRMGSAINSRVTSELFNFVSFLRSFQENKKQLSYCNCWYFLL